VINVLLTVAFLASATIAVSHVVNRAFIAPRYDCALNLLAFGCQATVATLLDAWPALVVSSVGITCWLLLTGRTVRALTAARDLRTDRRPTERSTSPSGKRLTLR
jgi:hypothetical protein